MENQPQTHTHNHNIPDPPRPPEYVKLPADDYREMVVAAFEPRDPVTAGQRVGRTAETFAGFAGFGLLVAGVGWAGVKAVNYLEDRRLQREMRKDAAEEERKRVAKEMRSETGTTPPA
jgi:hypothetical protein